MRAYAALRAGPDGRTGIWYATPSGEPLKKYSPDPFAARIVYNEPQLAFSPDGKQLLLYRNGDNHREEAWLMPFPPDPAHPPHRIFTSVSNTGGTPQVSWTPDNRHVVLGLGSTEGSAQLWMADTRSEERYALTSGTKSRLNPVTSPDGARLLFSEGGLAEDIVSVDLASGSLEPFIATERNETLPMWAAKEPVMAYITDRNGPPEIWLHGPGAAERPLQAAAPPSSGERWFS